MALPIFTPSRIVLAAVVISLLLATGAAAQEALRMSLAGAEAARARREAAGRTDHYNLRLGPSRWSFSTGLGIEYSDNLRGSADDPQSDVSFRPQFETEMRWAISELNTLNLTVGAGYAAYARYSEYNRPFVTPGSELSFDFYIGDCWLNVHDRFAIQENGYLDPTVTGIGDYERLENAAGLSATWDLNKLILKAGYDHVNYVTLGDLRGWPDAALEVFSASSAWLLRPAMMAGLEGGLSLINYSAPDDLYSRLSYQDGIQWNAGAFFENQVSDYISARVSVGYTMFNPDSALAELAGEQFSGVYLLLGASHRVNKHLDYSLSAGRVLNFAYYGARVDQYFLTLDARWNVLWQTAIRTSFSYQHGTQGSLPRETYDWFGPGVTLERRLAAHLTASLGYRFYWRGSDLPSRDYSANVVSLNATYRF